MYRMNRCNDGIQNFQSMNQTTFNFEGSLTMPNQYMQYQNGYMPGCDMTPVYECPQENVCHKEIYHDVNHICPINTKIVNHHIYRHTYTPCYTCTEENVVCNMYDACNKF